MGRTLQKLATCRTAFQAEQVRAALREEGVEAFVDGANAGTALSYVGAGLGGVRVLVGEEDFYRALAILDRVDRDALALQGKSQAWFCGRCRQIVDANFQVCWSCEEPRSDVEQPFPAELAGELAAEPDPPAEPRHGADASPSNPYATPLTAEIGDRAAAPEQVEETVWRAWRAAVIGLFLFPIALHFYSILLLIHATGAGEFRPKTRRRYQGAWVLNAAAILAWSLVLRFYFFA